MLHELLSRYLKDIESSVRKLDRAYIERYEEEILTADRINLRIRIRFNTGHLLELNDAVVVEGRELKHLNYRYHFQDKHNNLIFRYDNTPHFPNLKSFPNHKHIADDVADSEKPSVLKLFEEIVRIAFD